MFKLILNNINLAFQEKCRVCILGNNGAGKTTLMKLIAGDDNAYEGHIAKKNNLTFGYLHQEPALEGNLTVIENIYKSLTKFTDLLSRFDEIANLLGEAEDSQFDKLMEEQSIIQEQIDFFDLWDLDRHINTIMTSLGCPDKNKISKNLSEGERRRVALCQLLLQNDMQE